MRRFVNIGMGGIRVAAALAMRAWASAASAQAPTRAATLFEEGKKLLEQGRVDEACAVLAESDKLEPAVGTLGLLAGCHEKQNKLGTAYKEYLETAARAAKQNDE